MQIYNSMTRKKGESQAHSSGKVGIYCCGPTVYNLTSTSATPGPSCVFDVLRRYLAWRGDGRAASCRISPTWTTR